MRGLSNRPSQASLSDFLFAVLTTKEPYHLRTTLPSGNVTLRRAIQHLKSNQSGSYVRVETEKNVYPKMPVVNSPSSPGKVQIHRGIEWGWA